MNTHPADATHYGNVSKAPYKIIDGVPWMFKGGQWMKRPDVMVHNLTLIAKLEPKPEPKPKPEPVSTPMVCASDLIGIERISKMTTPKSTTPPTVVLKLQPKSNAGLLTVAPHTCLGGVRPYGAK